MGPVARRPSPYLRALLVWCGGGAVSDAFGDWKTAQTASFLVGSEGNVRQWGPRPAGPVRPSGPLLFWCGGGAVSEAFGDWKTAQTASFLVFSESNVRQWGPWPAGPVRPSGPCCFGVAKAPFLRLLATGRQLRQLPKHTENVSQHQQREQDQQEQ